MLRPHYPCYVAGRPIHTEHDLEVFDKASGELATRVSLAGPAELEAGIAGAVEATAAMRRAASYERQAWLEHCVARFTERAEELAQVLCIEAGKPIRDSRGEVTRLIETFKVAAAEALRIGGEVLPLDITERARGYIGRWKHVPIGPCSFIAPFNFPLNLVAHKIAPALAVGNPFILKPASATPVGALLIAEVLAELDLPAGAFSVLPCAREAAGVFTTDERLKLLSFTGSPEVGWQLKSEAGRKKVVLELGGNAAVVVHEDADVADAAARILIGAYYQAGQSCISVQRIIAHASVYEELRERLIKGAQGLKTGSPQDEATSIGPLISERDALRLEQWIAAAVEGGATVLCGGARSGAYLDATLLEDVPRLADLYAKEAFGPVACLESYTDFDDALGRVNDSDFGLQAGVFTRDLYLAERAFDELEVGAVVIGDVPSWRVDHMPYGGVKQSGFGREGLRWAIEDMTEVRLMVVRGVQ